MSALILAILISFVACQSCPASSTQRLSALSGTFGCCGVGGQGTNSWFLGALGSRCTVTVSSNFSIYYDGTTLQLSSQWAKNIVKFIKGNKPNAPGYVYSGSDVRVDFIATRADNCDTKFTITYECEPAPTVYPIQSHIEYRVTGDNTTTGFVYLTMNPAYTVDGSTFSIRASTESYKGLKPPAFFIGTGYVPSLETYDFTNKTTPDGTGVFRFSFTKSSPVNGQYIIAMFAYGRFASVLFEATWAYNYPQLGNDELNTLVLKPSTPWTVQAQMPTSSKKFFLEFSREEPGGISTILVGAGFTPSLTQFTQKKVVTPNDSFGELSFDKTTWRGDNPGLYIVRVVTTNTTAGLLLKATW